MIGNLRLLGNAFEVSVVDRDDNRLQGSMGKLSHGQQWILLASMQKRNQLESTLLHELIEFANVQMGLGLDEKTICALETSLYAMLTDNGVDLLPLLATDSASHPVEEPKDERHGTR